MKINEQQINNQWEPLKTNEKNNKQPMKLMENQRETNDNQWNQLKNNKQINDNQLKNNEQPIQQQCCF